ncbi:signal recognition particle protein [Salmonella enterica subsp. enterica]|uniref:Signal recognition particle protein n=1 Tax=Salmonella enterica I TaxID=59201 RepID=A0A379WN90_SALET|nr:signal recognition particle protein [Salmonella enterica subsp. enterica]
MTGQDAANTAKAFNEALPLTGVVLTKVDGDARGGAALSIRHITGKPIKFLGVGEKTDALEPFHPGSYRLTYSRHGRRTVSYRRYRKQS